MKTWTPISRAHLGPQAAPKGEKAARAGSTSFIFTADEEVGGAYGAQWLVDKHPHLNEGSPRSDRRGAGRAGSVSRRSKRLYSARTGGREGHRLDTAEADRHFVVAYHAWSMLNDENAIYRRRSLRGSQGIGRCRLKRSPSTPSFDGRVLQGGSFRTHSSKARRDPGRLPERQSAEAASRRCWGGRRLHDRAVLLQHH